MFDHSFNGYMRYAFPHDELKPLSCTGSDGFKVLSVLCLCLHMLTAFVGALGDTDRLAVDAGCVGQEGRPTLNSFVALPSSSH
jgi:mannosidase alpha-like ER degradation enhancer 2